MTEPKEWLGKASMFMSGFIMLTPHRIALTCAPHLLKRYHLPPDVVPLFIYKVHSPMELSSFIGQLITNIIVWICRWASADRRVFRGISIFFGWTLFFSGLLSFILFKSGDDYGNFNYFFWSIILMTLTNGWFSASTFKLEGFIASMYGAGLPASGFFTFFLHKFCKWLSKRYGWEDFDHSILMIQFWSTIITLGITTAWWTIDIGMDIADTQDKVEPGGNKNAIDFGSSAATARELLKRLPNIISQYEVKLEKDTSYPANPNSGQITVSPVNPDTAQTYKGFKHTIPANQKINRITIHGHITDGIRQTDIEGVTFQNNGGVFVYFPLKDGNPELEKPLLICLSKNGQASQTDNKWYERTGTPNNYTWSEDNSLSGKNPNKISEFENKLGPIKGALESSGGDPGYPKSDSIEIDISQTSGDTAGNNSYYFSGGKEITVQKQRVNRSTTDTQESVSWRCYKHFNIAGFTLKKITHSDQDMTGSSGQKPLSNNMSETFTSVTAVFVYYNSTTSIEHPKVICIDQGNETRNWYRAGTAYNDWRDANNNFTGKDPSSTQGSTQVTETELNAAQAQPITPQGDNYIIKLNKRPKEVGGDKAIKYRTGNKEFTVSKTVGAKGTSVPENYVRYTHMPADGTTFTLNLVKHNGFTLDGITGGQNVTAVYVYYHSTGDSKHDFPLIVCVKTSSTTTTYAYHKRGNTWTAVDTELNKVDPDSHEPHLEVPTKGINKLFDANTVGGHAADWSPIFMLACSLGTVYAIYPGISPYQLVDYVIGNKIDLWISFTAAIPNFAVAILDIIDETASADCGPSGKHWFKGKSGPQQYYYLWHLFWLAFIPYVMCIYIFISLMHFPDGWISLKINGNPIVIGLICNVFNFVQEWTESVGFAGAGSQGTSGGRSDFNDDIAAFNVLFMFTIMVTCMFTEDG